MACTNASNYTPAAILKAQLLEKSNRETKEKVDFIRLWTYVVAAIGVSAMVFGLLAMYQESSAVCYLAFIFPLFTAPYTIAQRRKLHRMPTLRQEINLCRLLVQRMFLQNNRLNKENSRLEIQMNRLNNSQERLAQIAQQSDISLAELQTLCHEYADTNRSMKQIQQAKELQSFLAVFLQSDTDNDRCLSEQELDRLSQRLQVFHDGRLPIDDGILRQAFGISGAAGVSTTTLFKETRKLMKQHAQQDDGEDYWWEVDYPSDSFLTNVV